MSRPDPVSRPAESSGTDAAPDSFESALERLEGIVARMEGERLPLEELLACYEQGTGLLKSCGEYLQAAEQRIELIARDENDQPRTVAFPSSTAATATDAPAPSDNRPPDAAEPNTKGRGSTSREAKSSSAASSRASSSSNQAPEAGAAAGVTKSPRTNHEVSLF